MRPSPYHIPAYILHLPTQIRIVEDADEARRLIANQSEYLIQRYVSAGDYVVRKLRTIWSGPKHITSKIVQKPCEMPYNSPCMPVSTPKPRKNSLLVTSTTLTTQRRRSQLLTEVPHLSPYLQPSADPDLPQDSERDYIVSFSQPRDARLVDVGLQDRGPEAVAIVAFLAKLTVGNRGKLAAFVVDLMQDWDNQWVFLNLKRVVFTRSMDSSEDPLEETKTTENSALDLDATHRSYESLYLRPQVV